ncbi:hypothetical protein DITRI_Ditri17bG0039100 [Diplodiscus trichospermus]
MDIDPFWITGGWFLLGHNNFMATANISICSETSKKSQYAHALLLFLVLLLLISPLFARPAYFSSSYRQLFSTSSPSSAQQSAKNLNPFPTSCNPATTYTRTTSSSSSGAATSRERQFKAAAHSVPSGPNPESNK